MALTNPVKRQGERVGYERFSGPRTAFLASVFAVAALWAFMPAAVPNDFRAPIIATALFAIAAGFAAVAWRQRDESPGDVTYWDVAGAMTLIGICTAALIDPEQIVRISESTESKH